MLKRFTIVTLRQHFLLTCHKINLYIEHNSFLIVWKYFMRIVSIIFSVLGLLWCFNAARVYDIIPRILIFNICLFNIHTNCCWLFVFILCYINWLKDNTFLPYYMCVLRNIRSSLNVILFDHMLNYNLSRPHLSNGWPVKFDVCVQITFCCTAHTLFLIFTFVLHYHYYSIGTWKSAHAQVI